MPFIKRIVQPEYLCRQNPFLTSGEILHDQNKFILINYLNQLSSLAEHTNDIICEMLKNFDSISERTQSVGKRLDTAKNNLEKMPLKISNFILNEAANQTQFQTTIHAVNILPITTNMSPSLRDSYEKCLPPPELYLLDEIRSDGVKTMNSYSDPSFFFDHWRDMMGKELREKKKRRKRRIKNEDEKKIAELPKTRKTELVNMTSEMYSTRKPQIGEPSINLADKSVDAPVIPKQSGINTTDEEYLASIEAAVNEFALDTSTLSLPQSTSIVYKSKTGSVSKPLPPISPSKRSCDSPKSISPVSKGETSMNSSYLPQPPSPISSNSSISMPDIPAPPPPPPMQDFSSPVVQDTSPKVRPVSVQKVRETTVDDPRDQLLGAIRSGKSLKKVDPELVNKKGDAEPKKDDVSTILAQRLQFMALSDTSEDDTGEDNDEDWE